VRRRAGFTLIEVLVAVFVFATVVGALVSLVATNLARLGDARRELHATLLAEERMRELEAGAADGTLPDLGTSEESFAEPDDELAWQLVVEPLSLPLPPERADQPVPSSVFAATDGRFAATPSSVRRVELRVFLAEEGPESVDPFVALLVAPPDEGMLGLVEEEP
jgi:type II secretion system protein I